MREFFKNKNSSRRAFTLVEVLMAISLVAILSVSSIGLFTNSLDEAKFDATYREMLQLRKALIGDLDNTTIEGERIRFGYLGDMGSIPTGSQGLSAVYSIPTGVSSWAINSAANLGLGWNGPYIMSSTSTDYGKDAWGRDYVYNTSNAVPYILSYGSDGVQGGTGSAQDIQVDLPVELRSATVTGQITTSGAVYVGPAYVQIYYPSSNGAMSSQAVALSSGNSGQFTFNNIPFGLRSLKIQIPSSTSPLLTLGPQMFAVDNKNYFVQSTMLDVNPLFSDSNCNTINNVSYVANSMSLDTTNKRVNFKLNIQRSFSMSSLYTFNDTSSPRLQKIGINGVVYGCEGVLQHLMGGAALDRTFVDCDGLSKSVHLDENVNLALRNAWGVAAGTNIEAFMDFKNDISSLTYVDLRLGCDLLRISN